MLPMQRQTLAGVAPIREPPCYVAQLADLLDLEFDDVAALELTAQFQTAVPTGATAMTSPA